MQSKYQRYYSVRNPSEYYDLANIFEGDAYKFILDVPGYPSATMSFMVTISLLIHRRHAHNLIRPSKVLFSVAFLFLAA